MQEHHYKLYSTHLNTETDLLVFGHAGYPLIVFPTSMGRYFQNKDFKLIESVSHLVESGKVKIYCVDGIDEMSWYNKRIHPADRVKNHILYDKFIRYEIIPMIQLDSECPKVAVAGCSFGAYHAANIAFRYPEVVGYLIAMGGGFDIKGQLDGYYDDNVYYNNPPDFLPDLQKSALWEMGIILGTGSEDFCLPQNERLSRILTQKNISHWLDIRSGAVHDWHEWRAMFPEYVKTMNNVINEEVINYK